MSLIETIGYTFVRILREQMAAEDKHTFLTRNEGQPITHSLQNTSDTLPKFHMVEANTGLRRFSRP